MGLDDCIPRFLSSLDTPAILYRHLHGHSFYNVGFGFGVFDESTDPQSYNLIDPVRRDTVAVLPLGWAAIRFKANNPGAWAFHCTQPAHAIMGMGLNFVTSPDKLEPPPPATTSCLRTILVPESDEEGGDAANESDEAEEGSDRDGAGTDNPNDSSGGDENASSFPLAPKRMAVAMAASVLGALTIL